KLPCKRGLSAAAGPHNDSTLNSIRMQGHDSVFSFEGICRGGILPAHLMDSIIYHSICLKIGEQCNTPSCIPIRYTRTEGFNPRLLHRLPMEPAVCVGYSH